MQQLLIIHPGIRPDRPGTTAQLVAAVRDGAQAVSGVDTLVRSAAVVHPQDLLAASAYVFASAEHFGSMAGELKAMFDRCFYPLMRDTDPRHGGGSDSLLAGRAYAIVVTAGNDGSGAATAIERIVTGWRLRKIGPALIARRQGGVAGSTSGELDPADLDRARELGQALAEGLALGLF